MRGGREGGWQGMHAGARVAGWPAGRTAASGVVPLAGAGAGWRGRLRRAGPASPASGLSCVQPARQRPAPVATATHHTHTHTHARAASPAGYLFNIAFLRRVFTPTFTLHDVRRSGPLEVTTRWAMSMSLSFARGTPLGRVWDPTLTFTGTSIMAINPQTGGWVAEAVQQRGVGRGGAGGWAWWVQARGCCGSVGMWREGACPAASSCAPRGMSGPRSTPICCAPAPLLALPSSLPRPCAGRFCRHVDTWDAIQQQRYFSLEAFAHMLQQVRSPGFPCALRPAVCARAAGSSSFGTAATGGCCQLAAPRLSIL